MKKKNKLYIKKKKLKKLNQKESNSNNFSKKRAVNWKVVILSIIGLVALVLTFVVSWWFIIVPAIVIWINQKELNKERKI